MLHVEANTACPVNVDSDRITQILTNLLGNALAATPSAGTVTIRARMVAGRGEVTVADTGIGLAHDDLQHVFERFYRVPNHPRRSKDLASASRSHEASPTPTAVTSAPLQQVPVSARPSPSPSPALPPRTGPDEPSIGARPHPTSGSAVLDAPRHEMVPSGAEAVGGDEFGVALSRRRSVGISWLPAMQMGAGGFSA